MSDLVLGVTIELESEKEEVVCGACLPLTLIHIIDCSRGRGSSDLLKNFNTREPLQA